MWVNCQHVHFHMCAQTYPVLLENTTTVVVTDCRPCCERVSVKCNTVQVCKYADSFAHTHSRTCVEATSRFVWAQSSTFSTSYIIVGAIRPMLHQCDITLTAPECSMLLCFKQQLCLFLAIIVLLFFSFKLYII